MASYNLVVLMGNLTKDPELRYTSNNAAVCSFSLAVNRTYTDGNGEKKDEVCFVDIVCWNRLAEVSAEYLRKGSPAFVEGRLVQRSWETEDGKARSKLEVVARSVRFLNSGQHSDNDDESSDDIPF